MLVLYKEVLDFEKSLNGEHFAANSRWLKKFKARHSIVFWTLHGKRKNMHDTLCEEWKTVSLSKHFAVYNADVFNMDEIEYFLQNVFF